jgi:hypothetical protein
MSYPINYPTPQGANVQIFRGTNGSTSNHYYLSDWVKPQGASFVWFTLIGSGGGGGGGAYSTLLSNTYYGGGGGSGAVTNFMCPAFLLPDILQIQVGDGGNGGAGSINGVGSAGVAGGQTVVFYQQKTGNGYRLLEAAGGQAGSGADATPGIEGNGGSGTGASTTTGGPMTAAGFYNSIAGQNGATGGTGTLNGDGITFLNGGIGCYYSNGVSTGYYGYSASAANGYAQLSPIPLAISGATPVSSTTKQKASPFGCGGCGGGDLVSGGSSNIYGTRGGDGLVVIVTW